MILNNTLKVRFQFTVIAQCNNNVWLMGVTHCQLYHRVMHAWVNICTGPDDVIFCVKPKVLLHMWWGGELSYC